jgi:hypothetical protein
VKPNASPASPLRIEPAETQSIILLAYDHEGWTAFGERTSDPLVVLSMIFSVEPLGGFAPRGEVAQC